MTNNRETPACAPAPQTPFQRLEQLLQLCQTLPALDLLCDPLSGFIPSAGRERPPLYPPRIRGIPQTSSKGLQGEERRLALQELPDEILAETPPEDLVRLFFSQPVGSFAGQLSIQERKRLIIIIIICLFLVHLFEVDFAGGRERRLRSCYLCSNFRVKDLAKVRISYQSQPFLPTSAAAA